MPTKICTKCSEEKDLNCFSVNKRNKTDGRQPKCKDCNRAYYKANQGRVKKRVRENYEQNHQEILERRRELRKRPEAKAKKAELDAAYYKKNKGRLKGYYREWASENREYLREYQKEWYWENLEHARVQGRASQHRRRCIIRKSAANTLTSDEIKDLLSLQPFCSYCGDTDRLEVDHIVPVSKGGENNVDNVDNVVVACKSCNCSKGDKNLIHWLAGL